MKRVWILLVASALFAADLSIWKRPKNHFDNSDSKEIIELGAMLFFDPRLSKDDSVSCGDCHVPYLYWTDGRSKAKGIKNKIGRRNTPTIINVRYLSRFFWDARASSLEEQAWGPITDEKEMGSSQEEVIKKLKSIKGYAQRFKKLFPNEGISKKTVAVALAAFQKSIVSAETPFDRWVEGKENLHEKAIKGYEIFVGKGRCVSCHSGYNFTNESLNNIALGDADRGFYDVSKNPIWLYAFKTPTLRNVEMTAPYFHDGSAKTLFEAVYICGNGGRFEDIPRSPFFRDRGLSLEEVELVVEFLKSLTEPRPLYVPPKLP